MKWATALINWISSFDHDFIYNTEGSDHQNILELQNITNQQLPADYVCFLESLGISDGGLFAVMGAVTNVFVVQEYCKAQHQEFNPNTGVIPFAVGDVYDSVVFDTNRDKKNPPLRLFGNGKLENIISKSLQNFAFQRAFLFESGTKGFTLSLECSPSTSNICQLTTALSTAGFIEEWFSEDSIYCARSQNYQLVGHDSSGTGVIELLLTGDSRKGTRLLGDNLSSLLQASVIEWVHQPTLEEARQLQY
jgi:hypothetical protein